MSKSLKLKDPKNVQTRPKPRPEHPKHSKLTEAEEKYIADLLMAKIVSPDKDRPKSRPVQEDFSTQIEEERKKGAIRKRPPPLQEPASASRPQSSFIMDDVLYTSRYVFQN